jgi:hypothetical protein
MHDACGDGGVLDPADIQRSLDEVTPSLLLPLRASKTLDPTATTDLTGIGCQVSQVAPSVEEIPGSLVGKSWLVFPTLLAEADHTSTPEPILARRGTGQSFSAAAGNEVLTCQGCLTRLSAAP